MVFRESRMDRKALSLPILIAMVVGNIIGTGIFVLPAALAPFGTISIASWGLSSVGALLIALTFTRLNKRYPKTGGAYVYCKHAFGDLSAFIIAIIYWCGQAGSIAGLTITSVGYLGYLFPSLNSNLPSFNTTTLLIAELSIIWTFTIINVLGVHFSGMVQLWLTIIKISPLLIVIAFGASHIHWDYLKHFTTGHQSPWVDLTQAAAITFWAFVGLEVATMPAENTRGPKDIARATIYSTLIASGIYIASTIVLMGMIPLTQLMSSQFPVAEAGAMLFGPFGALLIALFACLSGMGALNVCLFMQGQIIFSAARDGLFTKRLAKLSKHDVPIYGLLLSAILTSMLLIATIQPTLLQQFKFVILLASLLTLIIYFSVMVAEIKLTIQETSLKQALAKPSIWIALIAACYALLMIASIDKLIIAIGLLLISVCALVYYFWVRKKTYVTIH